MSKPTKSSQTPTRQQILALKECHTELLKASWEAGDCLSGIALVTENHQLATKYISDMFPDILVREARKAINHQMELYDRLDDLVKQLGAVEVRS